MIPDSTWVGLRWIDHAAGTAKGSAFRLFKQQESQLREGRDYCVLDHLHDAARITQLKSAGQVYGSSVQVILLTPVLAQQLLQKLLHPDDA